MSAAEVEAVTPYLLYKDVDAALGWMSRVLGFAELERYVDSAGVAQQAHVAAGQSEVWLSKVRAGSGHEQPGFRYLVVWVNDVDAHYERVRAAGVEAPAPADRTWGVRSFNVDDPEGYTWGITRRLARGYQQIKSMEGGGLREIRSDRKRGGDRS